MAGPYTLVTRLGGGGFGTVWLAHSPEGAEFACKVSRLRRDEPNGFRFAREVRYQSQLLHSGIMPVLDFDLEADHPWFVMPLATRVLSEAREDLTQDQVVQVLSRICGALSYAHKNGKIHRDLKPDNVLQLDGQESSWVIADFGLGRDIEQPTSHRTAANVAAGSRGYAAPEQTTNFADADERADIFACGQILHFLFTGVTLPAGAPPADESGVFAYVIRRATAYSANERYQQIDDLYADLQLLAYGGQDLQSPERQALSILNQVARNRTSATLIDGLIRILYTNQSDQRLYLNVIPRLQRGVLDQILKDHPHMSLDILRRYIAYLDTPLPVDYIEMAARFLETVHEEVESPQLRAEITARILRLGASINSYVLRAQCARLLGATSKPEDIAEFVRIYRPDEYLLEWASAHGLANGRPRALARVLTGEVQ